MNTFRQNGNSAARSTQRPATKKPQSGARQSQTTTTKTTKKVVAGPNGQPVQVVEERTVKKTMWSRAVNGASKATKPSTWMHSGKSANNPPTHASKQGKDSAGFNMSYYRKSFFMLEKQAQFDLYVNGLAPKMTLWEVNKLKASRRHAVRVFRPHAVMYEAHVSPRGYAAPTRDLVAEAKAAKRRAAATAQARKTKLANSTAAAPGDALPVHPTPAHYAKMNQTRPTKAQQQQQQQQRQKEAEQRLHKQQLEEQRRLQLLQLQEQQRLKQQQQQQAARSVASSSRN
ncbi:hypothetical protein F5144DRAFT_618719 [Chaetomium tenue]|uniref:Uncharacterized protein n=1 Tax=Chaetomium tenue TaxID=1854479 RepID=A0ACB7PJB6_9PEZI|nr:hypothetical protein F5144DRAFT_618719 [Chaetomium globosum]